MWSYEINWVRKARLGPLRRCAGGDVGHRTLYGRSVESDQVEHTHNHATALGTDSEDAALSLCDAAMKYR